MPGLTLMCLSNGAMPPQDAHLKAACRVDEQIGAQVAQEGAAAALTTQQLSRAHLGIACHI